MGSHLIHQDADGIGMIWERESRNKERRESISMAHAGRELSDICIMAMLRARMTLYLNGENRSALEEMQNKFESIDSKVSEEIKHWHTLEYGNE
jgi:molecular chaperone DnaK (HSP70)